MSDRTSHDLYRKIHRVNSFSLRFMYEIMASSPKLHFEVVKMEHAASLSSDTFHFTADLFMFKIAVFAFWGRYLMAPRMSKAAWRVLLGLGEQPACPAGDGIEFNSNLAVASTSLVHDDSCCCCCCCCCCRRRCLPEGDVLPAKLACSSPALDPYRPGGEGMEAANSPDTTSCLVPDPRRRSSPGDASCRERPRSHGVRYAEPSPATTPLQREADPPTGLSLGNAN